MSYKLYLDDVRPIPEGWIGVRNYDEFVKIVKEKGIPSEVSFDHDLGEDVAIHLASKGISKRKARATKKGVKNGYDCVKWFLNHLTENNLNPDMIFKVHSMNPVGRERITLLILDFIKNGKI